MPLPAGRSANISVVSTLYCHSGNFLSRNLQTKIMRFPLKHAGMTRHCIVDMTLDYTDGQTPLEEDEKEGLLIPTITNCAELDEFEQLGVEKANEWLLTKKFSIDKILNEEFVRDLHRRMFSDIWEWTGEFRKTEKNIRVDPITITIELTNLLDDCKYWIDNKVFDEDEITVRLSHRIV